MYFPLVFFCVGSLCSPSFLIFSLFFLFLLVFSPLFFSFFTFSFFMCLTVDELSNGSAHIDAEDFRFLEHQSHIMMNKTTVACLTYHSLTAHSERAHKRNNNRRAGRTV